MGWLILWLDLMCALPEMTKVDICCHESLQKKIDQTVLHIHQMFDSPLNKCTQGTVQSENNF